MPLFIIYLNYSVKVLVKSLSKHLSKLIGLFALLFFLSIIVGALLQHNIYLENFGHF